MLFVPMQALPMILILTSLLALCLPLASRDPFKVGYARLDARHGSPLYFRILENRASSPAEVATPPLSPLSAGRYWLLFGLVVNWLGDTGAYYIGRRWGQHKLAPIVSPGKS